MASAPYDPDGGTRPAGADRRDDETRRERSVGEHVFIWIAWALAAIFWGATATIFAGILHDAGQAVAAPSAAGAPGGMGYLALVVIAFAAVSLALAYGYARTAWTGRVERRRPGDTPDLGGPAEGARGETAAR